MTKTILEVDSKEYILILKEASLKSVDGIIYDNKPAIRMKHWFITRMLWAAKVMRELYLDRRLSFRLSTKQLITWARLTKVFPAVEALKFITANASDMDDWEIEVAWSVAGCWFKDWEKWLPSEQK